MPAVPLGVQAYSRSASSQPETRLVNLFMEKDESGASPDEWMRLQRPGLTTIASNLGAIRAAYQSDNSIAAIPVIVAGAKWCMLQGTSQIDIGTIENDGLPARIEATFERIGVVSAGEFYIYDGETVTRVQQRDLEDASNPSVKLSDLETIIDVDVLNGYFVLATSTGKFYWLVPGETSVNPLAFATAEALPDGALAVRRLRDDLYFFGANSIEVWQASGDADAAFSRAAGRLVDRGCMSRDSVAVFDNSLVWVGEDGIVYRMSDVPERISDFGIEEKIKRRDDRPSAWVFTSFGHKFYVLRIPGVGTFAYDAATKLWCEFASVGQTTWAPIVGRDTATGAIAGDASGKLYALDPDSSLDDGQPFLRLVTGTVPIPAKPLANSSLALGVGCDTDADFRVRWQDPRRDWSQPVTVTARDGSDILNIWRLGMTRAPFRTFEISTVSDAIIRISGAVANEGWRV
jgi:hypothetical protein